MLRAKLLADRNALSVDVVSTNSRIIMRRLSHMKIFRNARSVLMYLPHGNEVSPAFIISTYSSAKKIYAPLIDGDNLKAARITKKTCYEPGVFGVPKPLAESILNDLSELDVVIVPGIAFDVFGHRIGFGKGYYDRLLKKLRAVKIGLAFESQLVEKIPTQNYDVPVDYLITEKRLILCQHYNNKTRQSTKYSGKK